MRACLASMRQSREIVAEETAEFKPRDKRQKAPAGGSAGQLQQALERRRLIDIKGLRHYVVRGRQSLAGQPLTGLRGGWRWLGG